MTPRYWVNRKTRLCSMTTGPVDAEMARDGFEEVTESAMQAFREETTCARDAGWKGSPRTFGKFLAKHKERHA